MRCFHSIATALVGCLLTFSASGQITLSAELLTNPGAETGDLSGWSAYPIGGSPTTPTADDGSFSPSISPHTGSWMFLGDTPGSGSGSVSALWQLVDLTTVSGINLSAIDAGEVEARYSFWEQSLNQSPLAADYALVSLVFRNASQTTLGTASSPNLANVSDFSGIDWQSYTADVLVPTGTRSIAFSIQFYRSGSGYIEAFVDDASLRLISASAVPEPATTTVLSAVAIMAATLLRRPRHRLLPT